MLLPLPVLILLLATARAEPVLQSPPPAVPLQAPAQERLGLRLALRLERLQAGLLALALDRLIYIDMIPTPGVQGGAEAGAEGPPGPPPAGQPGPSGPPPRGSPPHPQEPR